MKSKQLLLLSLLSITSIVACNASNNGTSSLFGSSDSIENSQNYSSSKSNSVLDSASSLNYEALGILKSPGKTVSLYDDFDSQEQYDKFSAYINTVKKFSSNLVDNFNVFFNKDLKDTNYSISPISIYSALAMAASITKDKTQSELLDFLNTSKDDLSTYYKYLFSNLEREFKDFESEEIYDKSHLSNSIWVDKAFPVKESGLNVLADDMYCYSIKQDFKSDNETANKNMRDFIYDQTNKFLDINLNLNPETVFVLLNCYYLKSVWENSYQGLDLTTKNYEFTNSNGTKISTKLIVKDKDAIRLNKQANYSSIYVPGSHSTKVHFILPTEGNSINSVFNKATLDQVINCSYDNIDENKEYYTTTYFPEFEANCDKNIVDLLKDMGVNSLFNDCNADFYPLTDDNTTVVSEIRHISKLKVDKTGVEGAAITVLVDTATSMPQERKKIYEELVINKPFGYVITRANVPVFSGIVNVVNPVK